MTESNCGQFIAPCGYMETRLNPNRAKFVDFLTNFIILHTERWTGNQMLAFFKPQNLRRTAILKRTLFFNHSTQADDALSREEETGRNCKARIGLLKEHTDTRKNAQLVWKRTRLERMLIDHFLRSGYYETAILMAKKADIEV